jgi:iron-sulfur cluster assembly accessory protein
MITITEKAKDKITERFKEDFLRLSLSGGGCNGFQYKWELEQAPRDNDYVIEDRIVIDDISMGYLVGTIIDWKETLVETGFEIHNPNEQSACGCGTSVGF